MSKHEDPNDDDKEDDYGGLMGHMEIIHDPRDYEIVAAWEPGQCCANCDCGSLHTVRDAIWCSVTTQSKKKRSTPSLLTIVAAPTSPMTRKN